MEGSSQPEPAMGGHAPSASEENMERGAGGESAADAELKLLKDAQAGDRGAFGEFVLSTQDRLYTVLVRIVGDREEARELAQETYLKALAALSKFRGASAGYTWLYRIGVNLAIARLRKVRRQRTFSLDAAQPGAHGASGTRIDRAADGEGPAEMVETQERSREVLAALGRLDSEYRAVLVMRDIDGLDYKDISEVLGLPLGTVKSRLFRARLALRDELNRYLTGPSHFNSKGVWS